MGYNPDAHTKCKMNTGHRFYLTHSLRNCMAVYNIKLVQRKIQRAIWGIWNSEMNLDITEKQIFTG